MPNTCPACGQPLPPAAEAAVTLSLASTGSAFATGGAASLPQPRGPIALHFDVIIETLPDIDSRAEVGLVRAVAEAVQQATMLATERAGGRTLEIAWSAA